MFYDITIWHHYTKVANLYIRTNSNTFLALVIKGSFVLHGQPLHTRASLWASVTMEIMMRARAFFSSRAWTSGSEGGDELKDQCNERESLCVNKFVAVERYAQIFILGRVRDTGSRERKEREQRDGQRVFGVSDDIPGRGWTDPEGKCADDHYAWQCVFRKKEIVHF